MAQADHSVQQGRVEKAIALYEQAIEICPEQVSAYYSLALLHHKQGDIDEAIANFEKFHAIPLLPNVIC